MDIQHTFVLDDGSHTVESCQQRELFQHFSKVERIADREAPQYSMQQVLDMAGLTWANVPEAVRRNWLGEASSGSGFKPSSSVKATSASSASSGVKARSGVLDLAGEEAGESAEGDEDDGDGSEAPQEDGTEDEYDESSGGRLANAFHNDDLQQPARPSRGRGRGRRGGAGGGGGAHHRRSRGGQGGAESLDVRVFAQEQAKGAKLDAQAVKAMGYVKAGMDQLKALSQDNWSELVTEGSANSIKKELDRYAGVFTHKNPTVYDSIMECSYYSSLVPFMAAWRLHRGTLPDDILAGQYEHLKTLKEALMRFADNAELAPGLALLHMDAAFLHAVQQQGVADALGMLNLHAAKEIIRRQSNLFKPGSTSDEVVGVSLVSSRLQVIVSCKSHPE